MDLFDSIPYTFGEQNFEIRLYYNDTIINVVAFLRGYPANGYRYQVKIPKGCDAKGVLEEHPVPELVEACKRDIKENKWDKLQKIIHKNRVN